METKANAPTGSKRRLEFEYDVQGRRIKKKVTNLDTSAITETKYVYDGWNLLAEIDVNGNTAIRTYVWGMVKSPVQGPTLLLQ